MKDVAGPARRRNIWDVFCAKAKFVPAAISSKHRATADQLLASELMRTCCLAHPLELDAAQVRGNRFSRSFIAARSSQN